MTTPIPDNGGIFYQGGCRVHGTSIILPDDESGQLLGPTTSNGGHRGHQGPDTPALSSARRRSPPSVSSSPLASPIPPLGPAPPYDHSNCSDRMHKSCACVSFIAEHTKAREEATKVRILTYFDNFCSILNLVCTAGVPHSRTICFLWCISRSLWPTKSKPKSSRRPLSFKLYANTK